MYIPYYMHLLIMQTSIDEMHMLYLQLSGTLIDSPINDSAHATSIGLPLGAILKNKMKTKFNGEGAKCCSSRQTNC
jgi:hypothetical protein